MYERDPMREALDFGKITDFGKTARDYGRYRAGFPDPFFERLAALGIGRDRSYGGWSWHCTESPVSA